MPPAHESFRLRPSGFLVASALPLASPPTPIDRQVPAERHKAHVSNTDSLGSLTVGNGNFAFPAYVTDLQTSLRHHAKGLPLGTESEWGGPRFPRN